VAIGINTTGSLLDGTMGLSVPEQVHVAPLGIERDRVVEPPVEHSADRVVLLQYLPGSLRHHLEDEAIETTFDDHGIDCEVVEVEIEDLFDAVAAFGRVLGAHADDRVYVNLASGDKVTAIGGMIACMADGSAQPYYVEAEEYGSLQPPAPRGVRSIDTVPTYHIERPERQHLAIMAHVADSERTNAAGDPYRIKRELFEYGERAGLPFMLDFDGDTDKGKFRRLDAHVISPLSERGYVEIEQVGTQKRVFLTEDGRNTLRAFEYLLE
jgi:hypothetical protein